jgi:hypothetical protein
MHYHLVQQNSKLDQDQKKISLYTQVKEGMNTGSPQRKRGKSIKKREKNTAGGSSRK